MGRGGDAIFGGGPASGAAGFNVEGDRTLTARLVDGWPFRFIGRGAGPPGRGRVGGGVAEGGMGVAACGLMPRAAPRPGARVAGGRRGRRVGRGAGAGDGTVPPPPGPLLLRVRGA